MHQKKSSKEFRFAPIPLRRSAKIARLRSGVLMALPLLLASTCLADSQTWTNSTGNFLWGTPGNWSGNVVPSASTDALFTGTPSAGIGSVDLGGASQVSNTLHFSNVSGGSYTIKNGSLSLSGIEQDPGSFGNTLGSNASPNGTMINASNLTADVSGGILHVYAQITAANLAVSPESSGGLIELRNTTNALSTVQIAANGALAAYDPGSLGAANVQLSGGTLDLYSNIINTNYGNDLTVSGLNNYIQGDAASVMSNNTLNMGSLTFTAGSALTFNTRHGYTIAFTSTSLTGPVNLIGATGAPQGTSQLSLGAVTETGSGSALVLDGSGTIFLNQASSYTGGTDIDGGMVVISADHAAGTGAINVQPNGAVNITSALSTLPTLNIGVGGAPYAALIGNLTGAQYSGATENVFLSPGSILGITAGPVPVRGVDVSSAAYYLGITSNTQSAIVGDDAAHTSIYTGAAFGLYTPGSAAFSGTISAAQAGQNIPIYLATGNHEFSSATFNTSDQSTGVDFFGPGGVTFDNAPLGSATVYTHAGNGSATQGIYTVALNAANTLVAGKTFNLTDGIFNSPTQNAVANGATVNINSGATLYLAGGTAHSGPTTGTFNINAGGAMYLTGNNVNPAYAATPGNGATFNYAPGSLIIMDGNLNTGSPTFLPSTSDMIINAPGTIAVSGSGIVLGDGRRLTTSADNFVTMTGGTGISAAPGAASVRITASGQDSVLQINDPLNLPNTDLLIGDNNNFTTTVYTIRVSDTQDGTVILNNNASQVKDLALSAGNLVIGSAATDHFSTGNYTQNGGTAKVHGQLQLAGALTINNGSMQLAANNGASPDSSVASLALSAGATLDITDNTVDIASATASSIRSEIVPAFDNGKWDGAGLTSSLAGAASENAAGIGYNLTGSAAKIRLTWYGDTDLNGIVNAADLSAMSPSGTTWATGDFNYDGKVNADDYALAMLGAAFGSSTNISTVPEPATMLICCLLPFFVDSRRRKSR